MLRITLLSAVVLSPVLLGLAACGPQPKLDDGINPYASSGAPPAVKPPLKP